MFAEKWNVSPFDIMQKDIDDFILLSNYIIELGGEAQEDKKPAARVKKDTRIKVNDNTATGGWY